MVYETPALRTVIFKASYVIEQRQGLTCILGDVGLGKSTVLRTIHGRIAASDEFRTAFLPSPNYPSDFALLKAICAEFDLPPRRSMLTQENELRLFLAGLNAEGKTAALFIDEAQRLKGAQMELIRVLINLETHKAKLLQIVLAAQLELQNKLRDPSKRAIRSRIFLPSLLSPLSLPEAAAMVSFRCERAYISNPFPDDTLQAIYDASQGIPRELLKIAQAGYVLMKAQGMKSIPVESVPMMVKEASLYE